MTNDQSVPIAHNLVAALNKLEESLRPFVQALAGIAEAIHPFVSAIAPKFEQLVRYHKFIDSVGATGWLPYYTISLVYVEECGDDVSLIDTRITSFYRNNWNVIREDIETRLDQYQLSEETKATLREALAAHDVGHYRCVCRVLFPAVEREFRIHFFEDRAGSISSTRLLEKLTNRGELESFLPREAYGWILFGRLIDHLYEPVDDGNRAQFEEDFVPNRHASIHGLVPYSTFKHSVNMLVMADYIFQVLTSTAELASPQH